MRGRRDADTLKTLVSEDHRQTLVVRRASCPSCASMLDAEAQFCGMCGDRTRPRSSLVGTVLDELYVIEDKLAEGQTATVYRARYIPSDLQVALKVLHPELASDPIVTERFRREAKCLTRLRDAHTVAAYDHGEAADGTLYIAMELLRGEGLDVRVRTRGAMPWREVLSILRSVGRSLAEAHSHGIVHRDLKPANIRVGADGAVKVIDFGLAKLRPNALDEELTHAGHAVGTLQYMAPEQLVGQTCDGRADLYALGVIGLELLMGRPRTPGAAPAVLPVEVPRSVEQLLLRCLAPNPEDRFSTAIELLLELERILTPPPPEPPPKAARRVFAHTSAFELEPPRLVIDSARIPTFVDARGSDPEIDAAIETSRQPRGWRMWAFAFLVCGVGFGAAVAGCV
ncbi:MAG: protein kinase [Myxococcales bacterium]|nr:protein kinase [Myxococcales bacterium]